VGMSCSLGDHEAVCDELAREEDTCMTLAYDGLTIGPWLAGVNKSEVPLSSSHVFVFSYPPARIFNTLNRNVTAVELEALPCDFSVDA
jgi:hypothetical protein